MQMYIEMANSDAHHISKQYMQMKIKDNYTERYRGGKLFVVSNSMKGILEKKKSGYINSGKFNQYVCSKIDESEFL